MAFHILFFGNGFHLPRLVKAKVETAGEDGQVSLLGLVSRVAKVEQPTEYDRILLLRDDAPLSEWHGMALTVNAAEPVTHIGAVGEYCQDIAAEVGKALGIPTYHPETVRLVHDKYVMRGRLFEQGLEAMAFATVTSPTELREFADGHGYPCIVKPRRGTASSGVSVLRTADASGEAFAKAAAASGGSGVIVEAFLEGPQYSVEAFSEGGHHVILAVTRKYSDPLSLVELGHVLPAPLEAAQQAVIAAYITDALNALGVDFGPTHSEIVLTADGPRLIETHLRPGGDEIWKMAAAALGVDLDDFLVRQCLGEQVLPDLRAALADPGRATRSEAIWFAGPPSGGALVEVAGAEGPHPGGVVVDVRGGSGTELRGLESSYSRIARARAHADRPEAALTLAQEAIGRLRIVSRVSPEQLEVV
jgi:biotin carboxylase